MTSIEGAADRPKLKLIVLGATGATGRLIVTQALEHGHDVTALARRPDAVGVSHPHLTVTRFDVLHPDLDLAGLVARHGAVLSALGSRERRPTTVYSTGVAAMAKVMESAGGGRLLCVSSAGVEIPRRLPWWQRVVMAQVIDRLYRYQYADMVRMESRLRGARLDWTVVRAPRLVDGPPGGPARVSLGDPILDGGSLRRSELARFMLDAVNQPETYGRVAYLASSRRPAP